MKENLDTDVTFPVPPTYLPGLVNVVSECPLILGRNYLETELSHAHNLRIKVIIT